MAGVDPLTPLLEKAGLRASTAEIRDLVAGVAAAPRGIDATAWLALLPSPPPPDLRAALLSMETETRTSFAREESTPVTSGRLDALRAELARQKLDGFLVPMEDEYQGETIPRAAARLPWLTGFTGSAGFAVVLPAKAAIFVDGRYTLQVREQVDPDCFTPLHLIENPPGKWLQAALEPGMKIGFDPWLLTASGLKPFSKACAVAKATLVACEENPVDCIWADRPPPPLSPVRAHDLRFSGRESTAKRVEIAASLGDADAAFLSQPATIAWLLNVRGGDVAHTPLPLSFAILYRDGSLDWFLDRRKLSSNLRAHLGPDVCVKPRRDLADVLAKLGREKRTILCHPRSTPVWVDARLRQAGASVREGLDPCALGKACKNAVELEGARAAHIRDGVAMVRFLSFLAEEGPKGRLTEISAADALEEFRRHGEYFQDLSFPTISGGGDHGAIVHYQVSPETDRNLAPGMLYLVDSGAQYLDGTTDVTRTLAIGIPNDEQRDRFTRVLKGHIALAQARFPEGTTGSQLDALARGPLWQIGLDYDHGTGHGVGSYLGVHEGPQGISKRPNAVGLRPGMILSNEPGYYKAGAYGIRIENLLVVVVAGVGLAGDGTALEFETLTLAPMDRSLIDAALLNPAETAWLDAYHARVFKTLSPLLGTSERDWLKAATQPI
ncbi:MAG: X-Pro aminopeptidase [Rhodospirillaceae bacterium]|nr:MAG: X-Pro aminopeptidase [Rhodospirillaceae bacterium]